VCTGAFVLYINIKILDLSSGYLEVIAAICFDDTYTNGSSFDGAKIFPSIRMVKE